MISLTKWKKVQVILILGAATAVVGQAQTFTTLVNFNGGNGANPEVPPAQGPDGKLYGTTYAGGAGVMVNMCRNNGCGVILSIDPNGQWQKTQYFNWLNGKGPESALTLAADGAFYGTSSQGGEYSWGTFFRLSRGDQLTTLHSFCAQANCTDGFEPTGSVAQGRGGAFYGVTYFGGDPDCGDYYGCGTVYEITPDGRFTTLHAFGAGDQGFFPLGLILGSDGNFYGTTSPELGQNGTIFRVTPSGTVITLYTFCSQQHCADGMWPSGIVQGSDGNLYGAASAGGAANSYCPYGCGTIFRLSLAGQYTVLYTFCVEEPCNDGADPLGPIQGNDGALYDVTGAGGDPTCQCGTIFKITMDGTLTTLYPFTSGEGSDPEGLMQDTNGRFYGATYLNRDYPCVVDGGCGTLFSFDAGLGPFVSLVNNFGKIGTNHGVLGQGLTGTTDVSFNGTPASFTVVSDTYIKATVPPGATTGYATVTTPSGTLTSNVPFRVLK